MTMTKLILTCWLAVVFVSANEALAADPIDKKATPQRLYAAGVPETGFLTLKTENYTVPLDATSGWTIEKMFYHDAVFSLNNGHYGTVLQPKGGDGGEPDTKKGPAKWSIRSS